MVAETAEYGHVGNVAADKEAERVRADHREHVHGSAVSATTPIIRACYWAAVLATVGN